MDINSTLIKETLKGSASFVSKVSAQATNYTTEFFANKGYVLNGWFDKILVMFLACLLIFVGIKIAKPVIKLILMLLGGLLIIGLIISVTGF